jgi:hypothetical protein
LRAAKSDESGWKLRQIWGRWFAGAAPVAVVYFASNDSTSAV